MGQINKGTIASIDGNTARVVPSDANAKPTAKITIPWHLRGSTGNLKKGTDVVYVEFDDSTGLLLGRADGEWGGISSKPDSRKGGNTEGRRRGLWNKPEKPQARRRGNRQRNHTGSEVKEG